MTFKLSSMYSGHVLQFTVISNVNTKYVMIINLPHIEYESESVHDDFIFMPSC